MQLLLNLNYKYLFDNLDDLNRKELFFHWLRNKYIQFFIFIIEKRIRTKVYINKNAFN